MSSSCWCRRSRGGHWSTPSFKIRRIGPSPTSPTGVATGLLRQMGWSALIYGLLIAMFAWLLGDHGWAVATRRTLAPALNASTGMVVAATAVLLLLLWVWSPGRVFDGWATGLTLVVADRRRGRLRCERRPTLSRPTMPVSSPLRREQTGQLARRATAVVARRTRSPGSRSGAARSPDARCTPSRPASQQSTACTPRSAPRALRSVRHALHLEWGPRRRSQPWSRRRSPRSRPTIQSSTCRWRPSSHCSPVQCWWCCCGRRSRDRSLLGGPAVLEGPVEQPQQCRREHDRDEHRHDRLVVDDGGDER